MTIPNIHRVVYTFKPEPKSQANVWQLYSFITKSIDSFNDSTGKDNIEKLNSHVKINLIDFKVPRKLYYGVSNYINQIQLTFRTNNERERHALDSFLDTPLPKHEVYTFKKKA